MALMKTLEVQDQDCVNRALRQRLQNYKPVEEDNSIYLFRLTKCPAVSAQLTLASTNIFT